MISVWPCKVLCTVLILHRTRRSTVWEHFSLWWKLEACLSTSSPVANTLPTCYWVIVTKTWSLSCSLVFSPKYPTYILPSPRMSHEINHGVDNPINVVQCYSQNLRNLVAHRHAPSDCNDRWRVWQQTGNNDSAGDCQKSPKLSFVLDDDDEHDDVHDEDEKEGYEESAEMWDGWVSTKAASVVPLFVLYLKY